MPDKTLEVAEQSLAISDPGEKNREDHLWGDRLMINDGNIVAWIFPILMVAIVTQGIIRKAGYNQAWLDDAQWWMYGLAMIVGFGYAITTNSHVRVDILHQNYSTERKARIEVFAIGWLLLPFLVIMSDIMFHYAFASWKAGEGSDSANGLHRLYLLKMAMPVIFVLSGIAAWSVMYRNMMKFMDPRMWRLFIAAAPAILFITERLIHYGLWWFVRLTQPDLNPRRISREPLLEGSTWLAVGFMALVIIVSYLKNRKSASKE